MAQSKAYDSNAGQWPQFSGFEALRPSSFEFRVLRLDSSNRGRHLRYTMHHKEVIPATRYTALSYSWGAPVPPGALKEIVIEEGSVLIRPTLYAFLETLAAYDPEIDIWIDAVCINQSDVEERNQQISMMGRIFATAQKVYVWLGVGDDDTNYAFEHIDGSSVQTLFDERQFAPCVEKIFRSSYWTRRWVIQEFALAQELLIVCGSHVTPWSHLTQRVNGKVLQNDERASRTLDNFQEIQLLGTLKNLNLLDLMLRFHDSRCIDRRDKAFALRGIAQDGERFQADYKESVADVFFRILSLMETEMVLPKMTGYRLPHESATHLQQCLRMTKGDVLDSLQDKPSDRLFTVLEYIGQARSVSDASTPNFGPIFSKSVSIQERDGVTFHGTKDICVGDAVYRLQLSRSRSTPSRLYIAVKSKDEIFVSTGIILSTDTLSPDKFQSHVKSFDMIEQITRSGISMCSRNKWTVPHQTRALFHISRLAFTMLWLLDLWETAELLDVFQDVLHQDERSKLICKCIMDEKATPGLASDSLEGRDTSLEIMPLFENSDGRLLAEPLDDMWESDGLVSVESPRSVENFLQGEMYQAEDEYWNQGRNTLSFAAGDGLLAWTTHYLSLRTPHTSDHLGRTPLLWAIQRGHRNIIEALLASPNLDNESTDNKGFTPLMHAIRGQDESILRLMLDSGKFDVNSRGQANHSGRTPLSWAAQWRLGHMVEILLSSDKIDPDGLDSDHMTPLLWAARVGNEEAVRLLLATRRVEVNRKGIDNRTALSHAAEQEFAGIVELLLSQDGIQPDILDSDRMSPLRWADRKGNTKIMEMLLATGHVKSHFLKDRDVPHV